MKKVIYVSIILLGHKLLICREGNCRRCDAESGSSLGHDAG